MNIEEFTKIRDRWVWNKKMNSPLGDFNLELVNYSNSEVEPDARLIERAEDFLEKYAMDKYKIVEIVHEHYKRYCLEHAQWMVDCDVPNTLNIEELGGYLSAREAFIAVDDGFEFEGYLIHPKWEEEHKIQIQYSGGKLEVED